MQIATLTELEEILSVLDPELPYPPEAMRVPRGKTSGTQRVALPEGYLDNLDDDTSPGADVDADAASAGG
jgi:hypothetical protein